MRKTCARQAGATRSLLRRARAAEDCLDLAVRSPDPATVERTIRNAAEAVRTIEGFLAQADESTARSRIEAARDRLLKRFSAL